MSLLLYAFADCSPTQVTGEGLRGRLLRAVGDDGLVAVVSDHEGQLTLTPDALWTYEQAVELLMSRHAVLPARYGSTFETDSAARDMLRDRREELVGALERVRGAVELGVRVTWSTFEVESAPTEAEAGTAYMLGRLGRDRRGREIAERVDAPLAALARASSRHALTCAATPLAASYLVERGRTNEFLGQVHELDGAIEEAELLCTGPWPPYSFVAGLRS